MRSALSCLLGLLALPALAQQPDPLSTAKSKLAEAQAAVDAAIAAQNEAAPADEAAERLDTAEADIEELVRVQEGLVRQAQGDRLRWSASYRATLNNVRYDGDQGDTLSSNIWNHRLRLNLEANKGPLRLHARLAMYKSFGESWDGPVGGDARATRYPRDTALRVERLYLDWFVHDRVAITLGRVASPGGPPAELKENTARQATWGLQMVEAEFETLLVTFNLAPQLPGTTLRAFYSPFFHHAALDPSDDDSLFRDSGVDPTHIWGLLAETQWAQHLVQVGFVHLPAFRPEVFPLAAPDGTSVMPVALPDSLGGYMMFNALIELKALADVLDLFAAGSATRYAPDETIRYPGDVEIGLASHGEDDHWAFMAYGGGRYTLPFGAKLGVEVNWGSKHHAHWGAPSETLINKLATRGLAAEAYWIQPLTDDSFFMRLGVIHQARDWRGTFIGPAIRADDTVTNGYLLLNAAF